MASTALPVSGNPLAETVITALQDGRLLFSASDKRVFYKDKADKLFDAATGAAFNDPPPGDLSPIRLNNRLRGMVAAALGSLTLLSADAGRRFRGGAGGISNRTIRTRGLRSTRPSQRNRTRGSSRR